MSNDAAVTRQLNVLFVVSTEEGGGGQIGGKKSKTKSYYYDQHIIEELVRHRGKNALPEM